MSIKEQLLKELNDTLDKKISIVLEAIELAKEARDSDTKSSAGDKYETGRAMMQNELQKNTVQLNNLYQLKKDLTKVDTNQNTQTVGFGSLVFTNHGKYFISIGLGKVIYDSEEFYAISLSSPIGKVLQNKTQGATVNFNGKAMVIEEIY
ncbi:MAG: hypothetical protein MI922_02445 [Bacteroidales bacterium]|nr:hypothetical protein [Bacteroidales bacterium]